MVTWGCTLTPTGKMVMSTGWMLSPWGWMLTPSGVITAREGAMLIPVADTPTAAKHKVMAVSRCSQGGDLHTRQDVRVSRQGDL